MTASKLGWLSYCVLISPQRPSECHERKIMDLDHAFLLMPAQAFVGQHLQTYQGRPPALNAGLDPAQLRLLKQAQYGSFLKQAQYARMIAREGSTHSAAAQGGPRG